MRDHEVRNLLGIARRAKRNGRDFYPVADMCLRLIVEAWLAERLEVKEGSFAIQEEEDRRGTSANLFCLLYAYPTGHEIRMSIPPHKLAPETAKAVRARATRVPKPDHHRAQRRLPPEETSRELEELFEEVCKVMGAGRDELEEVVREVSPPERSGRR